MKQFLKNNRIVLIGAFILMLFPLYNGYPLLNGDTATYIYSGFGLHVPDDRPIFYGLFLRCCSLGASLWLPVFVQCLILSWLLTRLMRRIMPGMSDTVYAGILLLISIATVLSWNAGLILPDAFTCVLFLAGIQWVVFDNRRTAHILLLLLLFCVTLMHYSHVLISLFFFTGLLLFSFFRSGSFIRRKRVISLLVIPVLSWFTISTSNYLDGKGFVFSPFSHVFLMGKLAENGVLRVYLDRACNDKQYKICAFKDQLPPVAWEFVWSGDGAVAKTGGWQANREEYNAIISDIFRTPRYWPFLAFRSLEATARQIVLINIEESEESSAAQFGNGSNVFYAIQKHFASELGQEQVSRQNNKTVDVRFFDHVYGIVFILSCLFCLFFLPAAIRKEAIPIYVVLVLFLVSNAFVTASFANVLTRLNSRVIWLLPAVNFMFIVKAILHWVARWRSGGATSVN